MFPIRIYLWYVYILVIYFVTILWNWLDKEWVPKQAKQQ